MKKRKRNLKKMIPLAFSVVALAIIVIFTINKSKFSADSSPGITLTVGVDHNNQRAFPDGSDCVSANIEVIQKNGTYLTKEPIKIIKPGYANVKNTDGSTFANSGEGQSDLCITATKSALVNITFQIAKYPTIKRTINVDFRVNRNISDMTERQLFIRKTPITFKAKIDPVTAVGIKDAQLKYSYKRRYNSWGFWFSRQQTVSIKLNCDSEGTCFATLTGDHTYADKNTSGDFNYTFSFTDKNGSIFSRSFRGKLK